MKEAWSRDQQVGWGGIVLKNKLRNFKSRLKQWSKENGDVNINKIHHLRQKLNDIEDNASDRTLSEAKLMPKNFVCSKVQPIWWKTMSWLQIKGAFPLSPKQHFPSTFGCSSCWCKE